MKKTHTEQASTGEGDFFFNKTLGSLLQWGLMTAEEKVRNRGREREQINDNKIVFYSAVILPKKLSRSNDFLSNVLVMLDDNSLQNPC